jgi:hypothetical protein
MKAFPIKGAIYNGFGQADDVVENQGMDLRDYFAANVVVGLITIYSQIVPDDGISKKQAIAKMAYGMADELMEARKGE